MNEHSLHHFGSYTTRTVARRRRVHAARRRMAGMRARMAELQAGVVVDDLNGADEAHAADHAGWAG
jgi:hypothetical protein